MTGNWKNVYKRMDRAQLEDMKGAFNSDADRMGVNRTPEQTEILKSRLAYIDERIKEYEDV